MALFALSVPLVIEPFADVRLTIALARPFAMAVLAVRLELALVRVARATPREGATPLHIITEPLSTVDVAITPLERADPCSNGGPNSER